MTAPPGDSTVAADRSWVLEAVPSVSRTFALSIELLDEPLNAWIGTGYVLCRIADTLEDDADIPPTRRAELLETFDAMLDPADPTDADAFLAAVDDHRPEDPGPDWTVVSQTDRVMRVVESFDGPVQTAMREVAREMATGMADFLRRHADSGGLRLQTVSELEDYCWYVAGTVGELFTNLRACHDAGGASPDPGDARAFALLLQLINIAKDVRADWSEENNVYLPGEWLAEEGLEHADVADPGSAAAVAHVVGRVVDHAVSHSDGARRYLKTLPEKGRLLEAAALPYLLALGTVRELRGRTVEAVTRPDAVSMDRAEVEALYGRMERGLTQGDLDHIAATVRKRPYDG